MASSPYTLTSYYTKLIFYIMKGITFPTKIATTLLQIKKSSKNHSLETIMRFMIFT